MADGKGLVTGYTFPFETDSHGIISHVSHKLGEICPMAHVLSQVALDAVNPAELQVLSRLVVTTSTGGIQLWQRDKVQWTREEGLSDIRAAEMVELPESKIVASQVTSEDHESFTSRLYRQLSDAQVCLLSSILDTILISSVHVQSFPEYVVAFARRFATGSYASVSSSVAPQANDSLPLSRDAFGLRQIIVAATSHGKVFGLDSSNGEIVWSRVFGLGWAAEVGGRIIPLKVYVTRAVGDADGDTPQVAIVTERKADNVGAFRSVTRTNSADSIVLGSY